MSGHTKKRRINKDPIIQWLLVNVDNKAYIYRNVPQVKFQVLEKSLKELSIYQEETNWREDFAKSYSLITGEPAYKESAMAVKSARLSEGFSQSELARKLGIPQGNLSKVENAKRPVGKNLAKRLSEIFNLSYKVFLSELPIMRI